MSKRPSIILLKDLLTTQDIPTLHNFLFCTHHITTTCYVTAFISSSPCAPTYIHLSNGDFLFLFSLLIFSAFPQLTKSIFNSRQVGKENVAKRTDPSAKKEKKWNLVFVPFSLHFSSFFFLSLSLLQFHKLVCAFFCLCVNIGDRTFPFVFFQGRGKPKMKVEEKCTGKGTGREKSTHHLFILSLNRKGYEQIWLNVKQILLQKRK